LFDQAVFGVVYIAPVAVIADLPVKLHRQKILQTPDCFSENFIIKKYFN
jgi:hypothetical protein